MNKIPNWLNKNRKHVDFWVLGITFFLTLIGFGSTGLVAYLHWKMNGDIVYGIIWAVGVIVFAIAMIPIYRLHLAYKKLSGMNK